MTNEAAVTASPTVIATIPVGNGPFGVAVNPSTNRIYVTNYQDDTVSVIDGINHSVIATIPVGDGPSGIGVNPATNKVYVANHSSGDPVSVIDGETDTVIAQVPVALNAFDVGVNPNANRIYVTTQTGGPNRPYVQVIDGTNDMLVESILSVHPATCPSGVTVNPILNRVYVDDCNRMMVVINGATNSIETSLPGVGGGSNNFGIDVNPATARIYSVNGSVLDAPISGLDEITLDMIATVPIEPVGSLTWGVAVNPTTNRVFVSNFSGPVSVLDGTTNTFITPPIPVNKPRGIGVNPVTNRVYVANWDDDTVWVIADTPVEKTLEEKAAELAKTVVGPEYLLGGKGWEWDPDKRIPIANGIRETQQILQEGYTYWNACYEKYYDPIEEEWKCKGNIDVGKGLDCSGLVMWAYNKAFGATRYKDKENPNPIHYEGADGQFWNNSEPVSESDLKPGDLLFFNYKTEDDPPDRERIDHVAMYVGCCGPGGADVINATEEGVGIEWLKKDNLKMEDEFRGFRRRTEPAIPPFMVGALSPVNLVVTDPDGFTITAETLVVTEREQIREVPGELYYFEGDSDGDGERDDLVYAPELKIGDYFIRVVPEPGASPIDTYSLEVEAVGTVIILAQDVPISDIPSLGYGISSTGTEIVPFIPVAIDIKPGSDPNCFNSDGHGVIPVAILTTDTFDAATVDPFSVSLDGAGIRMKGKSGNAGSLEDIDNDGDLDLMVQIVDIDGTYLEGETIATLTGEILDGSHVKGTDTICIVP
jgi:YVTN family beta-propeller protein